MLRPRLHHHTFTADTEPCGLRINIVNGSSSSSPMHCIDPKAPPSPLPPQSTGCSPIPLFSVEFQWFFDRIVGSTRELAGYGGPPVPVPHMGGQDGLILGWREGLAFHTVAELVTPPEPAQLSRPTLYVTANEGPIFGAISFNKTLQNLVFFGTPGCRVLKGEGLLGKGRLSEVWGFFVAHQLEL